MKLEAKRQELLQEHGNQIISQADIAEIDSLVAEYRETLLENKQAEYDAKQKAIEAKLDLINELIDEEEECAVEGVITETDSTDTPDTMF